MNPDATALLAGLVRAVVGREVDRVAVVGNAPLPPSPDRAARIDGADAVIRMTTFATDRAEPLVGKRTDVVVVHRAVAAGPSTCADYPRRRYLLAEPGRDFWEPAARPAWWPRDLPIVPIPNREFTRPLRGVLRIRRRAIVWPTTGTLAVHLAHRLFPHARISLAGVGLAPPTRGRAAVLDHAWGDAVRLTPEHRLAAERRALREWAAEGWLEVLE